MIRKKLMEWVSHPPHQFFFDGFPNEFRGESRFDYIANTKCPISTEDLVFGWQIFGSYLGHEVKTPSTSGPSISNHGNPQFNLHRILALVKTP